MHKPKNNIPILSMLLVFIIDFILILTIHLNWDRVTNKYLPLESQIKSLKTELSVGHLWLEEAIGGDTYVDIQKDVFDRFKAYSLRNYINLNQEMLNEQENYFIFERLSKIEEESNRFYKLAIDRWENARVQKIGSSYDQSFDESYNALINRIDEFIDVINSKLKSELEKRELHFIYILCIFFLLNTIVFILLYKTKKSNIEYELQLKEQKKRAQITLSSIAEGVITTDEEGYIEFINETASSIIGYSNNEVLGVHLDEILTLYSEETNEEIDSPVQKVINDGVVVGFANHTILRNRFGQSYHIEDSAAPIKDEDGKLLGVVLIFRDTSHEKKIQKQLAENQQYMMEQSRLASMGEMLENIAHQWRQPLSLITTAASGIKLHQEMGVLDEKSLVDYISGIEKNAQNLSKTIDDFRDFFKPQKEKILLNVEDVAKKAIKTLDAKLQYNAIKVVMDTQKVEIKGFSNELLQMFLTLLNNSIDAFEKRDMKNKLIFVEIKKYQDKSVVIRIKDNAKGIPDSIISRIFEPYFTTKHKSNGTGIGLFMVQELVSKHMNGTIKASNKKYQYKNINYKGAQFKIEIPL